MPEYQQHLPQLEAGHQAWPTISAMITLDEIDVLSNVNLYDLVNNLSVRHTEDIMTKPD